MKGRWSGDKQEAGHNCFIQLGKRQRKDRKKDREKMGKKIEKRWEKEVEK